MVFSQYYDTAYWVAKKIAAAFPGKPIGLYAGSGKSMLLLDGRELRKEREELKQMVGRHELTILIGTDAASEGLNLQALGTLINIDLPWNPTKLEQRKGRIQRIGQKRESVKILNLRYKDSVEDRVHQVLAGRLQEIYRLFGQIPDVLEETSGSTSPWVKSKKPARSSTACRCTIRSTNATVRFRASPTGKPAPRCSTATRSWSS